jgi:tetratricopeptide (TPR) repeat protein
VATNAPRPGSADTAAIAVIKDLPPLAPPAPAPQAPAPPTAPTPPMIDAERRNEVAQAFLAHRRQDCFDLLGLPEDTNLQQVEDAYLEFAHRYAPWEFAGPGLESIAEQARTLFLAGARAFDELTHGERRSMALQRRVTLREERRQRAPAAGAFEIKTDLLDSEAQFKKGRALMELGRYREAILQLEFAADCEPQNGLYAAELAYCRFLSSSAHSTQALNELREALRRDPDCGIALYYAGEIERSLGHFDDAEAYLRRAIKAMSPDRRPIQALKALASDRKRS